MTPEQGALLRKAQRSIAGAELLAAQDMCDFAVSRTYYAMFYIAEAFLLGEGLSFSKHSAVIAEFGQRFAKSGRLPVEFHRYLIDAQASRNRGDYDIVAEVTSVEAAEQLARAAQFLALAEQHIGPLPQSSHENT